MKTIEGAFWETEQNEYRIQFQCNKKEGTDISEVFFGWDIVARGHHPENETEVLIFRKKFANRMDFKREIRDIKKITNINLKEIK